MPRDSMLGRDCSMEDNVARVEVEVSPQQIQVRSTGQILQQWNATGSTREALTWLQALYYDVV